MVGADEDHAHQLGYEAIVLPPDARAVGHDRSDFLQKSLRLSGGQDISGRLIDLDPSRQQSHGDDDLLLPLIRAEHQVGRYMIETTGRPISCSEIDRDGMAPLESCGSDGLTVSLQIQLEKDRELAVIGGRGGSPQVLIEGQELGMGTDVEPKLVVNGVLLKLDGRYPFHRPIRNRERD